MIIGSCQNRAQNLLYISSDDIFERLFPAFLVVYVVHTAITLEKTYHLTHLLPIHDDNNKKIKRSNMNNVFNQFKNFVLIK